MKKCITNESYCINGRIDHKPNDKKCEAYNKKSEILATQVKERALCYELQWSDKHKKGNLKYLCW